MALGQGMVTWSYAGLTMCSDQNVVSVGGEDSFVFRLQTIYLVSGLISTCNQRQEIEEPGVGWGNTTTF